MPLVSRESIVESRKEIERQGPQSSDDDLRGTYRKLSDARVYKPDRMAAGATNHGRDLRPHGALSHQSAVRSHEPDAASSDFGRKQHRRGMRHRSDREVDRFFQMAMASATELQSELSLGVELGFAEADTAVVAQGSIVEVRKMLSALLTKLRRAM